MSRRIWQRICFDKAKMHVVCKALAAEVIKDLAARDVSLQDMNAKAEAIYGPNVKTITECVIDLPGMVHCGRPLESFAFLGLALEIPSEDVTDFAAALDSSAERIFLGSGRSYFKLHSTFACLVLTPSQRRVLLGLLRARALFAEVRATEFWAGRKTPGEVLKEACGAAPEEDLGGHKVDRFAKLKAGGAA